MSYLRNRFLVDQQLHLTSRFHGSHDRPKFASPPASSSKEFKRIQKKLFMLVEASTTTKQISIVASVYTMEQIQR
jgi:hypothetical protein